MDAMDSGRVGVGHRTLLLLNGLALAGCWIFAVVSRSRLPEQFPAHWNLHGEVDRWASRDSMEWFLVPIIAAALAALMVGIALALPRIPLEYVNLPAKDKLLQLSDQARTSVMRAAGAWLLWMTLAQTLLMAALQVGTYLAAIGSPATVAWIAMVVCVVAVVWLLVAMWRDVKRRIANASAS